MHMLKPSYKEKFGVTLGAQCPKGYFKKWIETSDLICTKTPRKSNQTIVVERRRRLKKGNAEKKMGSNRGDKDGGSWWKCPHCGRSHPPKFKITKCSCGAITLTPAGYTKKD